MTPLKNSSGAAAKPQPVVDASHLTRLSFLFGPNPAHGFGEPAQNHRSELMDKKKLEGFRKRLETRQHDLRQTVSRTQADGRSADEDTAQDIADRAASSSAKEVLGSASTAARKSMPSDWRRCRGRGIASSARRSLSRDCWKRHRGRPN